jgi:hypothetical protein
MTSPSEMAVDHQMAAEDPQLVAPAMAWDPDAIAMPGPAEEPDAIAMPGPAEEPVAVSMGDPDQPMILSAPDAEAEPLPEPPATAADSMSARWREIQAMFVDDPRSSAERAASLVDDSVQELVGFVKEQQDSLLAGWHGQDTGTEELRTAVQHYRAFGSRLAAFCRER